MFTTVQLIPRKSVSRSSSDPSKSSDEVETTASGIFGIPASTVKERDVGGEREEGAKGGEADTAATETTITNFKMKSPPTHTKKRYS
jgi:hypothetical protein